MKSGFIFLIEDDGVEIKWDDKVLVFDTIEQANLFTEMFPSIFEDKSYIIIPEIYYHSDDGYINFNDITNDEFAEELESCEGILLN